MRMKAWFTESPELALVCGALSLYAGVRQVCGETGKNMELGYRTHAATRFQLCISGSGFGAGVLQGGCVEAMAEERA